MFDLGYIEAVENRYVFNSKGCEKWTVLKSEIRLLGEYSIENGASEVDHFLFIAGSADYYEFPVLTKGLDIFLADLSNFLNFSLELKLHQNNSFDSSIIYPESLSGEPLFDFIESKRRGVLGLVDSFIGSNEVKWSYSNDVLKYLKIDQ
tara:strand:- start:152 stop:598 length:447 start_codon:yes stop_codon:yes gene_type:complete